MQNKTQIVLASTSPFRIQQLKELGISFEAEAPKINEEDFKTLNLSAKDLVKKLAFEKANSLQPTHPRSFIIGSDQLVHFNNQILGKGGSPEKAIEQLLYLSGKTHELLTAVCLISPEGTALEFTDVTEVKVRKLSTKEASDYVYRNETWNCAGSYKIECQPALVIENIKTQDPTSIIGLPTFTLISWLKQKNLLA